MSSRLQDPTHRSAVPFCHGLRYAVLLGVMSSDLIDSDTSLEKMVSLSKIKWFGVDHEPHV